LCGESWCFDGLFLALKNVPLYPTLFFLFFFTLFLRGGQVPGWR
jgi:hypothetical protein